jgi:hypothetical protein
MVELPLSLRYLYKNILMSRIWYGKKKTNMEVFQKKFVEEAVELRKGFMMSVEEQHEQEFKLVVNDQVSDLVAKAPSVNFILHNGKFGSCSCLYPGEYMPGPSNKHIYPYLSNTFLHHTHDDTLLHAGLARNTEGTIFGVKGS